ncbi:MAG: hypothetical protein DYH08_10970 [Actinobacteria bacterium ATB1]|nr:hypothetical protein [Actinobacteria bacterium ATB1]
MTYNGETSPPVAAGSYAVAASVDTANYTGSASATLTIAKGSQSISFPELPAKVMGAQPFALSATATSGLPVSYASSLSRPACQPSQ